MNDASLYLAQLLGTYLLLTGILLMVRRKFFIHAVKDFLGNRAMRFVVPLIELVAGLALVLKHNEWATVPEAVISTVGWLMVIEPIVYLAMPEKKLVKMLSAMNKNGMYLVGGVLSIALGLYLVSVGFELSMVGASK